MRKREEVIGKAGAALAVLVGVALLIGVITVFNAERSKEKSQASGAITRLNAFRELSDQPPVELDKGASARAEVIAEREAAMKSTNACLTHVVRSEFQCGKVSTDGNTTVARCFVSAEEAMTAILRETGGRAIANAAGVGVAQNRGACVFVAVETR